MSRAAHVSSPFTGAPLRYTAFMAELESRFKEPCARRTIFKAFREAAIHVFGDAARVGVFLSEECRRLTDTPALNDLWLPERFVLEWYDAGLRASDGDRARYVVFLNKMMDFGFGRVRKALAGVVSGPRILRMSTDLWRHDHTTGSLLLLRCDERAKTAIVELRDHPYTTTALARESIAEIYRYCLSISRVSDAHATHAMQDDRLHVTLTWR